MTREALESVVRDFLDAVDGPDEAERRGCLRSIARALGQAERLTEIENAADRIVSGQLDPAP